MVVEMGELFEPRLQRCSVRNDELPKQRLQGAKQPLDTSVLPGAARIDALASNACDLEERSPLPPGEHGLVVSAHGIGHAMFGASRTELGQQSPSAFARESLYAQ